MPVAICSTNSASVALPKTYHQLAVLLGTGCSITGAMAPPSPASSHRPRERRQLSAAHRQHAIAHLVLVLEQAARRRPGGARAIFVVRAAVARTHEQT